MQSDYDNDGDLDLYVLRGAWLWAAGRHPGSLLRNDGSGRFTDVTFAAGDLAAHRGPTQTAAWGDSTATATSTSTSATSTAPTPTTRAIPPRSSTLRASSSATTATARSPRSPKAAGVALREYVKGVVFGDYDNDGDPDLYVSVLGGENQLFRNNGDGTFTDVTAAAGVGGPVSSFPTWFWDYDNDGNLDLYVSTYAGAEDTVALVAASYFGLRIPYELPRLYRGDGHGRFTDVAEGDGAAPLPRRHGLELRRPRQRRLARLLPGHRLSELRGADAQRALPRRRRPELRRRHHRRPASATCRRATRSSFADFDDDGDQDLFAQMGGAFPGDRFADALFENPGNGNHWIARRAGRARARTAPGSARASAST